MRRGGGTPTGLIETERLAGWWRRLLGYLIDGLIISLISYALFHEASGPTLIVQIAYWVFFVGYADHATIGMRILGMRVVPSDGRPTISYVDAFIRWVMMLVGAVALGLGFLWAAWSPRRQAWHDSVARTLVVMA
jgi:uncharacterized RDD family membrane protein YckC